MIDVPKPSKEQVELYLNKWESLETYKLQEKALDKLFHELCPENKNIKDVLLKCASLNDFYSTNIYSIYPVAKHITALNIDERLAKGDLSLVKDIQNVSIGGKEKLFYSFATKYCSHHNDKAYPICDSYVKKVLKLFRKADGFFRFKNQDLEDYQSLPILLYCLGVLPEILSFGRLYIERSRQVSLAFWERILSEQVLVEKHS